MAQNFLKPIPAKLWEEIYEACSTEEEREKIRAKCSELSEWLYDEYTDETDLDVLKVWSLSSFKVSRQLLMNDLNQVSSVYLVMTAWTALAN